MAPLGDLVLELDTGGGKKFQHDEPTAGLLPRNDDSSKMRLLEHFTKQLDQYEG